MNKCRDWNEIEDSDMYLENDPNEIDIFPVSVVYAVLSDGVPPVASPFILDVRSKRFVVQEEVVDIIMWRLDAYGTPRSL